MFFFVFSPFACLLAHGARLRRERAIDSQQVPPTEVDKTTIYTSLAVFSIRTLTSILHRVGPRAPTTVHKAHNPSPLPIVAIAPTPPGARTPCLRELFTHHDHTVLVANKHGGDQQASKRFHCTYSPVIYYHSICLSHILLKRVAILPQLAAKWVKEHHKTANAPNSVLFRVCDTLKYVERW